MISIVVVFPKREIALKFKAILMKNGLDVVAACMTGGQALHAMEELEGGILISGVRLPDMMYWELKESLSEYFDMIVIASKNQWQQYGDNETACLTMPLKGYDIVNLTESMIHELELKVKKDRSRPGKRTEEEQMVIDRAKSLLMKEYDYTEEEAHRFLQKRSMDTGTNIVETAYMVIDIF